MGLDMYLEGEHFIWEHGDKAEQATDLRAAIKGVVGETPGKVKNLVTEAAYWRKANAIHKWFVDNVQDGVDECQRVYVSREQLTKLRDLCKLAIIDLDSADETLPTQGGFFFGGIEYDENYVEDLEYTVTALTEALDEEKYPASDWDFYYQSSW